MNFDNEALQDFYKSLSYQLDKSFYMTATEYFEWVELFCGKPEEDEDTNERRRLL